MAETKRSGVPRGGQPPASPLFTMFHVYVLRSASSGHLYTGYTEDLQQRLGQHNHGITKSTKNRGPWVLVYSEQYLTRAEAMRRERFLKSGKGREEIEKLTAKGYSDSAE